jgi:positive regulator of sigma E activity
VVSENGKKTHRLASQPVYAPFLDISGEDMVVLAATVVVFFPVFFVLALVWRLQGLLLGFICHGCVVLVLGFFVRREFKRRPRKAIFLEMIFGYFLSSDFYLGRRD